MAFIIPIVSAISSAVSGFATMLGGLGWLGKTAVAIGFNIVGNALTKKKAKKSKQSETQQSGTSLNVTYGGARSREIGVGLFATAGQEVYTGAFGEANKTYVRVLQLSDFRISRVTRVLVDDEWCNLEGDNNSDRGYELTGKHKGFIRAKVYDGTQKTADSYLINSVGQWTKDHVGYGLSYVILYFDYDEKEMTSIPQMLFEVQGVCYDPRSDSSYGGYGAQRWDDPSTWEYSDNPIVQAYNYERGFFVNGQLVLGKELSPADLPILKWIEAMNLCDERVANQEKRYRSGMIFSAGEGVQHKDNLEPLFTACGGALVERVDGDTPLVGVTQPIVAKITDDDLISLETLNYRPKRSITELVNSVHGTYNEPEKSWEAVAYPAQSSETALAADGSHHGVQIDYKAVFAAGQAIRLAKSALRENRYQKQYTIVVRPLWRKLEVGDWVNVEFKRYGAGTYRVIGRSLTAANKNGARNINLTLQEVGTGIYDDSIEIPELPTNRPAAKTIYQNFPDGFRVIAGQAIAENEQRKIPVFDITWRQPTDVTVTGILIEYWQTSEPSRKLNKIVLGKQTAIRISGFAPKTSYTFRATVIPEPARATLWGGEVVVVSTAEDFDKEQFSKYIAELNQWAAFDQRYVKQELEKVSAVVADATAAGYEIGRSLKRELIVTVDNNRAEYKELISVAVSKTAALAVKVENLEAEVNGNIAQAFNELKTSVDIVDGKLTSTSKSVLSLNSKVDGLSAQVDQNAKATAESITSINAQYGELVSNITIRMEAVAAPDGMQARSGFTVKTGTGDNWSAASFFIDTKPGWSRIAFVANQLTIVNSNDVNGEMAQPFDFSNGLLRSNAADIGYVKAGELNINDRFKVARDGTVEINGGSDAGWSVLTNSRYEVYDHTGQIRVQLGVF